MILILSSLVNSSVWLVEPDITSFLTRSEPVNISLGKLTLRDGFLTLETSVRTGVVALAPRRGCSRSDLVLEALARLVLFKVGEGVGELASCLRFEGPPLEPLAAISELCGK